MYMKMKLKTNKSMIFNKWSRKSNSAFLSLGKTIKIAVLSAGYFLLNAFNTVAQTDTIKIQDVKVSAYKTPVSFADAARVINMASSEEISEAPLTSVQDALKSIMNVDLRERGVYGVQADLNIRGGSFEQNVVLINGVKMTDPQTGHFQMNLPIDLMDVDRIELLRGGSSSLYGNNAFSGAVNFITGNDNENHIRAGIIAGEYGLFSGNLSASVSSRNFKNYFSISKKVSDGYVKNTDFDILNLFYKGKLITKAGQLQMQAGFLDKSFGAFNFYTPRFPDQYEQNKTWMANLKFFSEGSVKTSPSIYWRRNFDRFELFRYEPASWYTNHNFHITDVYGAEMNGQISTGVGKLGFGVDWNTEEILSNVLGDVLDNEKDIPGVDSTKFSHGKTRQNLNLSFQERIKFGKFSALVHLLTNYNTMFDWNFYPGLDLSFSVNQELKLIASANWSGRVPSYTELYYSGGDSEGNPDLMAEKATSFEIGGKYFSKAFIIQSSVFYRKGENIIDWIRADVSENWKSQNLTSINTIGVDFLAKFDLKKRFSEQFPINFILLNYTYLDMDLNSGEVYSRYVLDYLRHNATFTLNHRIIKRLTANWQFNFQYRNGNYTPYSLENSSWEAPKAYKPLYLLDLKLNYKLEQFTIFAQVKNLFDTKNQNIENVFLPGRWISGGLIWDLKI
jgi:vitamin B12 transporter